MGLKKELVTKVESIDSKKINKKKLKKSIQKKNFNKDVLK